MSATESSQRYQLNLTSPSPQPLDSRTTKKGGFSLTKFPDYKSPFCNVSRDDIKIPSFGCTMPYPSMEPEISNPTPYAAAKAAKAAAAKALDEARATYAAKTAYAAAAVPRPGRKPETQASLDYIMRDISVPMSNGKTNWKPSSPPDPDEQLEVAQKMMSEQACKALEFYKDTEGEEFELVEIKDNEAAILPPYIIDHLTFMAKPRYLSDSCPKLFFAEIYERFGHTGEYEVKMCMTLDPSGPDVMKGCGYVQGDKNMLHPKGVKFWAGPPSGTPEWDKQNGIGSFSSDARRCGGFRNYGGDRDIPRVSRDDSHMESDDIKFPSFGCCGVAVGGNSFGAARQRKEDFMDIEESIGTGRKFGSTDIFSCTDYSTSVTPSPPRKPEVSNPAVAAAKAAEAAAAQALDEALAAYAAAAAAAAAAPRPRHKPETQASLDYMMRDISVPMSNGKTNWKPSSPPDPDEQLEVAQKMMSEQACKALEFYKDTEGEEFELVEIKDNEAAILPPYIIDHLTFMAKPRYLSDSCPKLFFAEIYERFGHTGEYEVKICMTLDPSGPDVMKGCGYIQGDKHMLHPKGVKFWAGPPSGTPEWDKQKGVGSSSPDPRRWYA